MPFTYTFAKDPFKMGDYDPKYGQAWWCEVNEHLQPVKFNIMSKRDLDIEDSIVAEERVEKQTQAKPGKPSKDYFQLRKVKVTEAYPSDPKEPLPEPPEAYTQEYPSTPEQANTVSKANNPQLDRIEKTQAIIIEKLNLLLNGPEEQEE